MTRRTPFLLLTAFAALSVSCQNPNPHATAQSSTKPTRFAANGGGGLCSLRSTRAEWQAGVTVMWGYPLTSEGYVTADAKRINLIYIVSGHPNAKFTSLTASNEEFSASLSFRGEVEGKRFTMLLEWNNQTEIVSAAHQQFRRTKGNVFVLLLESNGGGDVSAVAFAYSGCHMRGCSTARSAVLC